MGEMRVLDPKGDLKVIWDPENEDEVEAAKNQFDELVKEKGFAAFEVGLKGKRSKKQVREFNPDLGKLIMVPPIAGG